MKHIVVYSGGMDSFTLLHRVHRTAQPGSVQAISFDYGQRHSKELIYARAETKRLDIPHRIVDLRALTPLLAGSALTSPSIAVPEGHYEAESMRQTVVPGRNTLMLSIAMAWAESLILQDEAAAEQLAWLERPALPALKAIVHYGAHSGDHHIYPDCRPDFVNSMRETFLKATDGKVDLRVPFLHGNKSTILLEGQAMGLDYGRSWTCYKGEAVPCGKCGSCQERAEAFREVGMVDPGVESPSLFG